MSRRIRQDRPADGAGASDLHVFQPRSEKVQPRLDFMLQRGAMVLKVTPGAVQFTQFGRTAHIYSTGRVRWDT